MSEIEISRAGSLWAGVRAHIQRLFPGRQAIRAVPDGLRVYAIGDIHGCRVELDALLAKIEADAAGFDGKQQLVFLGDYVDRGPDSKGVLERLLGLRERRDMRAIRGNHDQFLLDFLGEPALFRQWRDYGGRETLMSYGVSPPLFDDDKAFVVARDAFRDALPASHLSFLQGLEYTIEIGDYYFVHAGVRPGVALDQQAREDLLSIRDDFLLSDAGFGKVVVHGHTPMDAPVRRHNRIGVDTGAYATGRLTATVLEGATCRFLST